VAGNGRWGGGGTDRPAWWKPNSGGQGARPRIGAAGGGGGQQASAPAAAVTDSAAGKRVVEGGGAGPNNDRQTR